MYSFFEKHLPRPFQHFEDRGLTDLSELPFCILERNNRCYSVAELPADGPTGKFYQDKATGPNGASYKYRKIVLSQSSARLVVCHH